MKCPDVGDLAPDFELQDQDGRIFRLSDLRGSIVVLYFYPKAMTRGCTIEAIGFRDHYESIRSLGAVVVGVSKDKIEDIKKFSEKYNLPFRLLADPDSKIIKLFCVGGVAGMARRVTFLIDDKGVIRKIWRKVDPSKHAQEVIEELKKISGKDREDVTR
ncbi:MAG: peroxiredoxin [Sulfolobales archaeon]